MPRLNAVDACDVGPPWILISSGGFSPGISSKSCSTYRSCQYSSFTAFTQHDLGIKVTASTPCFVEHSSSCRLSGRPRWGTPRHLVLTSIPHQSGHTTSSVSAPEDGNNPDTKTDAMQRAKEGIQLPCEDCLTIHQLHGTEVMYLHTGGFAQCVPLGGVCCQKPIHAVSHEHCCLAGPGR